MNRLVRKLWDTGASRAVNGINHTTWVSMTALDPHHTYACPHAEPIGPHNHDPEPVECQLCDWTGDTSELLHCGDTGRDYTGNLWTPCCRTVDWCFL